MKMRTTILLSLLVMPSASFAENVHVKRIDGGGQSSGAGGVVSNGGGGGETSGGRTTVQPSRGGGYHGGYHSRSGNVYSTRRVGVIPHSDAAIPRQHTAIVRNTTVIRNINQQQRVEVVPNRYYWHTNGGVRYCHYYHGGFHWYGFYDGPRFYWTRYHDDRWWWYDGGYSRWLFWSNGFWWYAAPGGVMYVYENDAYFPPNEAPVQAEAPAPAALPDEAATSEKKDASWKSPNGLRMVQTFGPRSEAFLYDTSKSAPLYVGYLGQSVQKVRFSGGDNDVPLQILVDFQDGTFAMFSADGKRRDAAGTSSAPGLDTPGGPPSTPPVP